MKKTTRFALALAVLLIAVTPAVGDDGPAGREAAQGTKVKAGPGNLLPINITYDNGGVQDFLQGLSGNLDTFGNIFNSALGGPLQAGTITGVSWFGVDGGGGADMILSFMGPPAGGVAQLYTFITFTGVVNSAFNSGVVSQPVGTSFLIGVYAGTFGGPDSVGMQNQTVNGQGFHGFQGDFLGASTVGSIAPLQATNAMVRAAGDLATVPVELQAFDIE